jgi:phosphatidate phosphatase APP1
VETEATVPGDIKIVDPDRDEILPIIQDYPVRFADNENPLIAISDIDDTLLVSYTANFWNRIRTILLTAPEKRKAVSFTIGILDAILQKRGTIFYVSKSESNLFGLLTRIILNHQLPEGNLSLTPYLHFRQLLKPKKGKDFKLKVIRRIIDNSPDKKFILLGDDTQQDMMVYTNIAKLYPDKILKIYIRKTIKQLFGNKLAYFNSLKETGIPLLYFSDQDPLEEEILILKKLNTKI